MVVLAHAGHWLPQLLYLMPVLVMLVALGLGRVRDRRRRGGDSPPTRRPGSSRWANPGRRATTRGAC